MLPLRQSTAITHPFFVHDVSGDPVTGLTDGSFTKRISKNGGAFAAMTVVITEMENGFYSVPISTAHSNTNGILTIVFTNAGAKQVNLQWRVSTRIYDDFAFPTVSGRGLDVTAGGEAGIDLDNAAGTLDAAQFSANSLDGKGDWNIGKTGYSLTQAFPTNFADLAITVTTGLVTLAAVTHTGAVIPTVSVLTGHTPQTADHTTGIADIPTVAEFNARTILAASYFDPAVDAVIVGTMNANVIDAASIAAAALNGKGDWNIGKTGYSLTQAFPTNFAALSITAGGLVTLAAVTHTGAVIPIVSVLTGHTAQTGDNFSRIGAPVGASISADIAAILTTAMTEAYAADGVAPTAAQALFAILQQAGEFAISGTVLTVKKLDGVATAMTFTLDDATNPTSRTRAT